ncbi:hypothetical protein SAMN05216232_3714 [Virgibacillus subterraneus]|uniref:Uncharacterized protein n=1 Tax=Virgibacillus subterraneus TaxID=621109 RepID=A0A1H9JZ79_9BACI|nr:hypothetical protein SAMN05216232_3714 [Virgibacillus subterraneus]
MVFGPCGVFLTRSEGGGYHLKRRGYQLECGFINLLRQLSTGMCLYQLVSMDIDRNMVLSTR